jgi:hypothetical protein
MKLPWKSPRLNFIPLNLNIIHHKVGKIDPEYTVRVSLIKSILDKQLIS